MSSADSSHYSPADIITYVGVPLTVLGLLPIVYNMIATLITLRKIKRKLRLSGVTASTRSDIINRVVEVEFPTYAVTPGDRLTSGLAARPSRISGGSWTIFEWERCEIGTKIQRVQYATQLRQPQVEVNFGDLVSYLHDLGAAPDQHGWKRLRSIGLWMPEGVSLMNSPDGSNKALFIASLDDSDGNLSLATTLDWSSAWIPQSSLSLSADRVRLPPPLVEEPATMARRVAEASSPQVGTMTSGELPEQKDTLRKETLDSPQEQADDKAKLAIICRVDSHGLSDARIQRPSPNVSAASNDILDIEHLRPQDGSHNSVWFASAATAYRTASQTILWSYRIPDVILNFAKKETVPCGVLVLLGIVDGSETPKWATEHDDQDAAGTLFLERITEQRRATQAEADMSSEKRYVAASERKRREQQQRIGDMHDQIRFEQQSCQALYHEALQSPRWDTSRVAEHSLTWLSTRGSASGTVSLKDAAGIVLRRMVLDEQFTFSICKVLDLWKTWADNGGMRGSDLAALQEAQDAFAQASLLMALVKDATTAREQTLIDLQACIGIWKTVRLG